jgi:hypothetical protein
MPAKLSKSKHACKGEARPYQAWSQILRKGRRHSSYGDMRRVEMQLMQRLKIGEEPEALATPPKFHEARLFEVVQKFLFNRSKGPSRTRRIKNATKLAGFFPKVKN